MKKYLVLIVYLTIAIASGLVCVLTAKKYFENPYEGTGNIDAIAFFGCVLALANSIKEIVQIMPYVKENILNGKSKYFKAKRMDVRIETDIDDQKECLNIEAISFRHKFHEKERRVLGDKNIGEQIFSDFYQEMYLHGRVRTENKVCRAGFEIFSDVPITAIELTKFLKIKCRCDQNKDLNFTIKRIQNSLHRFEILTDLGKVYSKGDEFKVKCCFTIPYFISSNGPECIFSNATYYFIREHIVEILFSESIPENLCVRVLDEKNELERRISPTKKNKNRFLEERKSIKKESKMQFEFLR